MARNKVPRGRRWRAFWTRPSASFWKKATTRPPSRTSWDQLGGLTKGAVYHHFKSKEEILDAVGDRMFLQNNPFEAVRRRTDLNGLQKAAGGHPPQPDRLRRFQHDGAVHPHHPQPPHPGGDDRVQPPAS